MSATRSHATRSWAALLLTAILRGAVGVLIISVLGACGGGVAHTPTMTSRPIAPAMVTTPVVGSPLPLLPTATLPPAWVGKPTPTPRCDASGFMLETV